MTGELLRPVERRIRDLLDAGVRSDEIAASFRHSPEWVGRVDAWSRLPNRASAKPPHQTLRPLERRVLGWRHDGVPYDEIASRFHRSPGFIEQVERLARYKIAR